MTDPDPAAVVATHTPYYGTPEEDCCSVCSDADGIANQWPCEPYRLAEALAASEAKVARVVGLVATPDLWWAPAVERREDIRNFIDVGFLMQALADQPEQAS